MNNLFKPFYTDTFSGMSYHLYGDIITPYFSATEIAKILKYHKDVFKMLKVVDEDDKIAVLNNGKYELYL